MTKPYYTLVAYNLEHDRWYSEFGDYDKSVVQDELDDMNQGYQGISKRHLKIIKTDSDDQRTINTVIRQFNYQ
mgnify:FL=1|tara:strand:- start:412 stop:630 length:219 start_codon:yes stop_codon:yes gene_type:complete